MRIKSNIALFGPGPSSSPLQRSWDLQQEKLCMWEEQDGVSLCFFPVPSEVGLMFLRCPNISMCLVGSCCCRTEDGGAGDGASSLHASQNLVTATSIHTCLSQELGGAGVPASPERENGVAGRSGKCKSHWQTVSSFQAGALTWIVGSRKGGFTRAFGFRFKGVIFSLFFFSLLFFFPFVFSLFFFS